jgi:hypothetical protein
MVSELKLPNNYRLIEEEMMYTEGGNAIALAVTFFGAGYASGQRYGYSGDRYQRNREYQQNKWQVRLIVMATLGVWGGVTLFGFKNGFYATL